MPYKTNWDAILKGAEGPPTVSGELDAWDKKDAWVQIQAFIKALPNGHHIRESGTPDEALRKAWDDPEANALIGIEMGKTIRATMKPDPDRLPPPGWGRKVLGVRDVTDKDKEAFEAHVTETGHAPRSATFRLGVSEGQPAATLVEGPYEPANLTKYVGGQGITNFIDVPAARFASFPSRAWDDPPTTKDHIEMTAAIALQEVSLLEDKSAYQLLKAVAQEHEFERFDYNSVMNQLRYHVEKHRHVASFLSISRKDFSDFIVSDLSKHTDPCVRRALLLNGFVGTLEGMKVVTAAGIGLEDVLRPGEVFLTADPEYIGMGIETIELFTEPFTVPDRELYRDLDLDELTAYTKAPPETRKTPLLPDHPNRPTTFLWMDGYTNRIAAIKARGWAFIELLHLATSGSKGVVRGLRRGAHV